MKREFTWILLVLVSIFSMTQVAMAEALTEVPDLLPVPENPRVQVSRVEGIPFYLLSFSWTTPQVIRDLWESRDIIAKKLNVVTPSFYLEADYKLGEDGSWQYEPFWDAYAIKDEDEVPMDCTFDGALSIGESHYFQDCLAEVPGADSIDFFCNNTIYFRIRFAVTYTGWDPASARKFVSPWSSQFTVSEIVFVDADDEEGEDSWLWGI